MTSTTTIYSPVDSLRLRIIKMSGGLIVLSGLNVNLIPIRKTLTLPRLPLSLSPTLTISISPTHSASLRYGPLIMLGGGEE